MHLISLLRILKQILCWSHLLLLAIFVCISMIPENMAIFVRKAGIQDNDNNNVEAQVHIEHFYNEIRYLTIYIIYFITVAVIICLIASCYILPLFDYCETIIRIIRNIIRDTYNNLRRSISHVLDIRNIQLVNPFHILVRPSVPVPDVLQYDLQVQYRRDDRYAEPPEYDY